MRVTMAQRRIVLSILKLLNDDVMIRSAINGIDPTISMGIVHESLEFEDVDAAGTNLRLVRLTSANSTGNLFKWTLYVFVSINHATEVYLTECN